jgi:hypothetical protein
MEHTTGQCAPCLLAHATELDSSTGGYSQPSFPFNILPGSVQTSCQGYSGYAFERCKADVKTRTELFITLAVILALVIVCIVLITILTCIRRVKARRRAEPASGAREKSKQRKRVVIPERKKRGDCNIANISRNRCITNRRSLDRDEAVEAAEQGIANYGTPATLDGMTDGWMHWIRERANMVFALYVLSKARTNNHLAAVES